MKTGTRGEFLTLSGRPVAIIGRVVRTVDKAGLVAFDESQDTDTTCPALARAATAQWHSPVASCIVDHVHNVPVTLRGAAEGAEPHSIALYTIARPLEGGLDAPATDEHMNQEQVEQYIAMMRSFPDAEAVFMAVDEFVEDVRSAAQTRDLLDLQPPLPTHILRQCEVAADMLLRTTVFSQVEASALPADRVHLVMVLECYIMARMHGPIMAWLSMLYLSQHRTLREVCHQLRGLQQADAGVKPAFRCSFTPVLDVLWSLVEAKSPLAKLQCLKRASAAIEACVTRHLKDIGQDIDSVELSADDRLNILLYIIVHGAHKYGTADLILHLQFVDMFGAILSSRTSNELSQKCIEYRVATEYLLTSGGSDLAAEMRARVEGAGDAAGTPGTPEQAAAAGAQQEEGGGGSARPELVDPEPTPLSSTADPTAPAVCSSVAQLAAGAGVGAASPSSSSVSSPQSKGRRTSLTRGSVISLGEDEEDEEGG